MSEFHYVRITGEEGGVDAVDGPAVGVDLETLLRDGLPPFKQSLEMIAALCEVLDIAEEDGEVHGDIGPEMVFLDDTGALSLEGFGEVRKRSRAPEKSPRGHATDAYGLGTVAFHLLTPHPLPELPDDDPDGHDDAIIDAIVSINFDAVPEAWVGDIQWYLAKLLSFDREDRPTALEAWRTFIAFSNDLEGDALEDWAPGAVDGGGVRRDRDAALAAPKGPPADELDGPVVSQGPLSKGAISFGGGATQGQATAFWSKDAMKAAMDSDDDDDAFKPAVGGGASTSFWSRDEMQAMADGSQDAPRPKRSKGAGARQTAFMAPPKREPPPSSEPEADSPSKGPETTFMPPPKRDPSPPPPAAAPPPPPPSAPAPASPPPVVAQAASQPSYDDDEDGGNGMMMAVIGGVVVLLLLVCGGVLAAVGGAYMMASDDGATASAVQVDEPKAEEPKAEEPKDDAGGRETGDADEAPEVKPEPKPKPKARSTKSTTTKSSSGTSGRRTTSAPAKAPSKITSTSGSVAPTAKPPSGKFTVRFSTLGRADISCGDAQKKQIDASGSMQFSSADGGTTCMVKLEGGHRCAGWIEKAATCSCKPGNDELVCR